MIIHVPKYRRSQAHAYGYIPYRYIPVGSTVKCFDWLNHLVQTFLVTSSRGYKLALSSTRAFQNDQFWRVLRPCPSPCKIYCLFWDQIFCELLIKISCKIVKKLLLKSLVWCYIVLKQKGRNKYVHFYMYAVHVLIYM